MKKLLKYIIKLEIFANQDNLGTQFNNYFQLYSYNGE